MSPRQAFRKLLRYNLNRDHAQRVIAAYRECLGGDAGDLMLDDLCLRFGVFDPKPSRTPEEALRREGARQVVVFLMSTTDRNADLNRLIDEATP